ncbi:hypothetical protein RchiOBHm_Chr6g0284431 [Rosa chinensis]|uniref:KIB1-4 beta-propeller domain-containing protein n=2 Tax=Rosa chinensis TaxID=74649 RepID=A0A2P6PUD9_ROSCH|nr:hypothetical protein RchiOBHm_Chr6g0284431 [Rosa chinensis]
MMAEEKFIGICASPLLMFSYSDPDSPSSQANIRELLNLTEDRPELNINKNQRCSYYSSLGCLMTISEDYKVNLLNPLDHHRAQIKLPDINMVKTSVEGINSGLMRRYDDMITKFVLSSNPFSSLECLVLVSYATATVTGWGFCRLGEDTWTYVAWTPILDLIYHNGQFYAMDFSGKILVCDVEDPKQPKTTILLSKKIPMVPMYGQTTSQSLYMVESAGALLVVLQSRPRIGSIETTRFKVFEVPFGREQGWEWSDLEVKNLENRSLFLGCESSSFSVDGSDYYSAGCKANCIYFNTKWWEWLSIPNSNFAPAVFIFNMEEEKVEQLSVPNILQAPLHTSWIQPQPPSS